MSVVWSGGLVLIALLLPTLAWSQVDSPAGSDPIPSPSATVAASPPDATGMKLGDALAKAWKDLLQILEAQLALDATAYDISSTGTGCYPFASVASAQGENDNSTVVQLIGSPPRSMAGQWISVVALRMTLSAVSLPT